MYNRVIFSVVSQPLSNSCVTNAGLHNESSCERYRLMAWNWFTYICFYVDSEVAAPSEALPLDEETPEDQPGTSAVTARVIPNNRRCKKLPVHVVYGIGRNITMTHTV